jgi:hypothetical protein
MVSERYLYLELLIVFEAHEQDRNKNEFKMAVLLVGECSPTSPHQKTSSTQSLPTGSQKDWPYEDMGRRRPVSQRRVAHCWHVDKRWSSVTVKAQNFKRTRCISTKWLGDPRTFLVKPSSMSPLQTLFLIRTISSAHQPELHLMVKVHLPPKQSSAPSVSQP